MVLNPFLIKSAETSAPKIDMDKINAAVNGTPIVPVQNPLLIESARAASYLPTETTALKIDMNKINAAANAGPTVKGTSGVVNPFQTNVATSNQGKRFTLLDSLKIQLAAQSGSNGAGSAPAYQQAPANPTAVQTGIQTMLNNAPALALSSDTMTVSNEKPALTSDNWNRWTALASADNTLTGEEKKEARSAISALRPSFVDASRIQLFGTPQEKKDYQDKLALANILEAKTNAGSAVAGGLFSSMPFSSTISDKGQQALQNYSSAVTDSSALSPSLASQNLLQTAQKSDPIAYNAGNIAGNVAQLYAAGEIAKGVVGAIKGFSSLPKLVQAAINSGITFGTVSGVNAADDNLGANANLGDKALHVAKETAIGTVGGAAGGAASFGMGVASDSVMKAFGLNPQNISILANTIKQGLSGAAFSGAKEASTYYIYPKGSRPTTQQISRDIITAFAFASITGLVNSIQASAAAKAEISQQVDELNSKYEQFAKSASYGNNMGRTDEEANALGQSILKYNQSVRDNIASKSFVGQQKAVDGILQSLDAMSESVKAGLSDMNGASSYATNADGTITFITTPETATQPTVSAQNTQGIYPDTESPSSFASATAQQGVNVVENPFIMASAALQAEQASIAQVWNPSIGAAPFATNDLPEGMGAMSNPYPYKQKQSNVGRKTFSRMYWDVLNQIEGDGANVTDLSYDVATEKQSIERAQQRLTTDLGGEMQDLPTKQSWSGEDLDTAMGIMDRLTSEASETHDYTEVNKWAKLIREKGTNAGQFIQAFAKYNRTPQGVLVKAVETLDKTNLNEAKKYAVLDTVSTFADTYNSIKDGDTTSMINLIEQQAKQRGNTGLFSKNVSKAVDKNLGKMDYTYLKDFALRQMDNIATDYVGSSFGKKTKTQQVLSQLTSLITSNRNLGGNFSLDFIDTFSQDSSGVLIDKLLSNFTGKRGVSFDKSWISPAKRHGAIDAATKSMLEVALDVDMSGGTNRYGKASSRTSKMIGNPVERFFSRWEELLGYTLTVPDQFFKGGTEAEITRGLTKVNANNSVSAGEITDAAQRTARYRTLQNVGKDEGVTASFSQGIHDAVNVLPGLGDSGKKMFGATVHEFGTGDLVNPYPKIPANLGVKPLEFSAPNIVKGGAELVDVMIKAKNGTLTIAQQNKAVMDISRGLTGVGLIAIFTALAKAGFIKNTENDDDADVKALDTSEGRTGTQLNLTAVQRWFQGKGTRTSWQKGDALMSADSLQPINAFMNIGVMLAELPDNATLWDKQKTTAMGAIQSVLDIPVMSNIQDIITTMNYSDADTLGGKAVEAAAGFVSNNVSGILLPAPIRQIAKASDNNYREYSGLLPTLENGIPGLRQTLPAKLTPFGADKTYTDNIPLNILNSVLLPGAIDKYKPTEATGELARLRESTGDAGVYPNRKAPNSFTYDDKTVTLTPDQKQTFQQSYGQTAYTAVTGLMSESQYNSLSDTEKAAAVQQAYSYSLQIAKAEISDYKPEAWVLQAQDMTEGERAEYMLFRAVWSSQGEGTKKADQVKAVTAGHDFSDAVLSTTMSESQEANYNKYAKGTVDIETYLLASSFCNSATTDKDAKGKAIKGKGAADKTLSYIDGLSLTGEQKRALAESVGIAEKTANHKWPKYMD